MEPVRSALAPSKLLVATLLLAGAAAVMASAVSAQSLEEMRAEPTDRLATPRIPAARPGFSARSVLARITTGSDSVWVGHSIQVENPLDHTTFSYGPFHVGVGLNRPKVAGTAAENSGVWTWDRFQPGETDSLQGWWPMRRAYSIATNTFLTDADRPWWAVDIGNQGNYVLPSAQGRTRGVVSYWHVDGGSSAAQTLIPGTNALAMTWAPLNGAGSAWCGLRAHGDLTYSDAITGNPLNVMVLEFNGETGGGTSCTGGGVGTNKKFPGYPSQMDQILYRDVEMTSASANLNLSFNYVTAMSTLTTTALLTRTGWFQFDPTKVGNVAVAGPNNGIPNYISNTGIGQPADSFMVYLGVPVDNSAAYLADGTNPPVYDLKRRWFSEVVALDKPLKEVLHVAGNNNASFTLTAEALSAFYNAQLGNPNKYLRIVLRAKSNRGFDDMGGSVVGAFSSGGKGAVIVDDVTISGANLSGGAVGTSTFDSPGDIDNGAGTEVLALGAWRATGKPPAVFHHTHPLSGGYVDSPTNANLYASLTYQDVCGPPGSAVRFCNMSGGVISMGDHDHGEAAGGLAAGTPERERMDGMVSPTILLASVAAGDYNACGIDKNDATTTDDYYVAYDIYAGIFNLFFTGNAYTFGFQSYPGRQNDNVLCWGEVRYPGFQVFSSDIHCYQEFQGAKQNGLIRTTLAGSRPDSLRIFLGKIQQCFRFGVTGGACSSTSGAYWDNISLLLSDAPPPTFAPGASITIDIGQWINDTFPVNDGTATLPIGYAVAPGTAGFDTAAAYLKTGINIAQSTGDANRFDIPGDSVVVIADVAESLSGLGRVDMVFRIKPGPGNYHTIGDPASGLRPVPTDPVNIVSPGDGSFWGQYMANPGYMSKGVHGPGNFWNKNVWNSARMDTAEANLWPVSSSHPGIFECSPNFANNARWMGTYHEGNDGAPDDAAQSARFNTLGITKNICFLDPNPLGAANSTNIICPGTSAGNINANYNNPPKTTKEGTKIIPDGLLTPGAHVEYFLRGQEELLRNDAAFVMVPETTFVSPQRNEGSTDGHRWQQFGVLPDRWKATSFNSGATPGESDAWGMACMLYVDWADRRGVERVWVSIADSVGLTSGGKRGNHNGWRARGDQSYTTAAGDPIDISGDPTIARYDHGGQPGSLWDMYGVKGAESLTSSAGQLGSRMGRQADGLALGKDSRQGPTLAMLAYYYKILFILTGDIKAGIFGRFTNRGQDDVKLLRDYLAGASGSSKRAVLIAGDGFVQSEYATGSNPATADHLTLLTDYLGVTIRLDPPVGGTPQYGYQSLSGNYNPYADLISSGPIAGNTYSVGNACLWGNDVLEPVANSTGAVASGFYQNFGSKGPYVAGVYTPMTGSKYYESFVDGWDLQHLFSLGGFDTMGRLYYYWKLMRHLNGASNLLCAPIDWGFPSYFLDVPSGQSFVDFMQLRNNPMLTGRANVHFGIAHADRVTARIYDVGGRLVRTLADRTFAAGEYDLTWDGSDDRGRRMERGVYFTQLAYARSGFKDVKKLTVLR